MYECPNDLVHSMHEHQMACCSDRLSLFYSVHNIEFRMGSIGKDSPMNFILILNIVTVISFIVAAILDTRKMIDYSDIYD
jgi:hypothetical protein